MYRKAKKHNKKKDKTTLYNYAQRSQIQWWSNILTGHLGPLLGERQDRQRQCQKTEIMYVIFLRCDRRTSNNKHNKQSHNNLQYKAEKKTKKIFRTTKLYKQRISKDFL